jgi:cell division septum initiation protein DivIVA
MNPADEMAAKIGPTERPASIDKLDEQLRVSVEALLHPSPPRPPVEELDDLLSAIDHHLDQETSERKKIYHRLAAIENEVKRPASRGFAGYLLAICIAVAATVAWQSYGQPAKQMIATSAPKLGWSPEAKQMIANWVQQLGWTKQSGGPEGAPPTVANVSKAPPALSPDPRQMQQIEADVAAMRQAVERHLAEMRAAVEQIAAGQDQMAGQITKLQAAEEETLAKIAAPPAKRPATPARKPTPIATPPSSRAPTH